MPGLVRRRWRSLPAGWLGTAARIGCGNMGGAGSPLCGRTTNITITHGSMSHLRLLPTAIAVLPPANDLAAPNNAVESRLVGLALVRDPQFSATSGLHGLGGQEGYLGRELGAGVGQVVQLRGQGCAGGPESAELGQLGLGLELLLGFFLCHDWFVLCYTFLLLRNDIGIVCIC